jgi:hypothetical protein
VVAKSVVVHSSVNTSVSERFSLCSYVNAGSGAVVGPVVPQLQRVLAWELGFLNP